MHPRMPELISHKGSLHYFLFLPLPHIFRDKAPDEPGQDFRLRSRVECVYALE